MFRDTWQLYILQISHNLLYFYFRGSYAFLPLRVYLQLSDDRLVFIISYMYLTMDGPLFVRQNVNVAGYQQRDGLSFSGLNRVE